MKKNRILALLLALVMVLGLTACGKDKKSDDPNHFELGDYVLDYKGSCIMYDEYGRDALVMTFDFTNNSKEDNSAGWVITSKCMQGGVQMETAYVLADADTYESITKEYWLDVAPGVTLEVKNAFQLSDMSEVTVEISEFWSSDTYTITVDPSSIERIENETSGNDDDWDLSWVYEDEDSEDSTDVEAEEPVEAEPEKTASFTDWWEGDWYGWWIISEGTGSYEDYVGYWWDAFARISVNDDLTGTFEIWDEDGSCDDLIGLINVSFTENGTGEHGMMVSESGEFMGGEREPGELAIDPNEAVYDELIAFQAVNGDDDGQYTFSVYLRPWGTIWDDVEDAELPYSYDWYLKYVEAGAAMPDKYDENAIPEAASTAATTAAATGNMIPFSVDGKTSNGTAIPVSFSLPEGTWDMEDQKFSYKIDLYNCPDTEEGTFGVPHIWIDLQDNEEKINFYVDSQYENLSETDGYTIGGIEMKGRKYDNWGYKQLQEYWGVLPSGAAVAIRLINMTDDALPDAYAILDTISFG